MKGGKWEGGNYVYIPLRQFIIIHNLRFLQLKEVLMNSRESREKRGRGYTCRTCMGMGVLRRIEGTSGRGDTGGTGSN